MRKKKVLGKVNVVRTLTLPSGKKIRILRKDILERVFKNMRK